MFPLSCVKRAFCISLIHVLYNMYVNRRQGERRKIVVWHIKDELQNGGGVG